ncbi:PREDICTED: olfactory receptor 1J2-like [Nanorana parkeri]|uniref:olfactory receptor 1J2-like n=1 Tax=Nanorana parkeri TaxID=125878 RepID=UPI0008545165|nr:PREDICTED: olfactory receptor 1J2-like [Nanorana parkeri]
MNGLFVLFLLIYLMTLIINLLIFFLVLTDHHLHNPMYFFLGNLAFLDMSYSSVTAPRMLFDLVTKSRSIALPACTAQVFFFLYFTSSELFLLSAMSYDRYIAICHPLHYTQIMSWRVCAYMASVVWVVGCICSLIHTLFLPRLSFCGPTSIHNLFCDLPHLFQIACTDPFVNIIVIFIAGASLGLGAFLLTFLPCVRIFITILRIRSKTGKLKAFSTCTSHLTVVFIFYGSLIFIYLVPTSSNMYNVNKLFSVMYALINPLLNPLIYSLRNKDLMEALKRSFYHIKSVKG